MVEVPYAIRDAYPAPGFQVWVARGPTMEYALAHVMQEDVSTFMTLSNGVIMRLLIILFRRVSGVVRLLAVDDTIHFMHLQPLLRRHRGPRGGGS